MPPFHERFGYYAQGVSKTTAVLPAGWGDRLRRYESPATNGVVTWCLEAHDLWLSEAAAMRLKAIEFCDALLERRIVRPDTLRPTSPPCRGWPPGSAIESTH